MEVRDAVEGDAEALAEFTDLPPEVLRTVIHDRTVRVLVEDEGGNEENDEGEDGSETDESVDEVGTPVGFLSFDVRDSTVHVTQFGGGRDVYDRLLDEPIRFADSEDLTVEVLVTAADDEMRAAVEAEGFEEEGPGPQFEGRETKRYRIEP